MSTESPQDVTNFGFAKTFVLPATLIFLVPVLGLLFFLYAQSSFNADFRDAILAQIQSDPQMTEQEKQEARDFYNEVPVSRLIQNEEFAKGMSSEARFHFATFRWMIRLALISILSSVVVLLLTGLCVLLSLWSLRAQYVSLSVGWHVLRLYGAMQAIIQGTLLVALSFWVTALWANMYSVKLIVVTGLLAVVAVGLVIAAIFKRPDTKFEVEGEVIGNEESMPLWPELQAICDQVGTDPPDQVIAGIDDNFFVTEQPITVGDKTSTGRSLFVSLSLLKELNSTEADAVLAHEMAHFSDQDTLYSLRISPLLNRYGHYLEALHHGAVTLPIFYFMLCFRALFEVSLSRLRRKREFRADAIAANVTSPRDLVGALLRIAAYTKYRGEVQEELFKTEVVLETADISDRIQQGFHAYAVKFSTEPDIGELQTTHPFDSHPPLAQRIESVGMLVGSVDARDLLVHPGDGEWFRNITGAEHLEQEQWNEFEENFRNFHEQTLPYRFLPETNAEREIVEKAFPEVRFESTGGSLVLDYQQLTFSDWPEPIPYGKVSGMTLKDNGDLRIDYAGEHKQNQILKMKAFSAQQDVLEAINKYYSRHQAAVEYQHSQENAGA